MSAGTIDFLVEISENEAFAVLQTAASQKSIFVFKLLESATPFQTTIESFYDRRVILDKEVAHLKFDIEQDVSIKFNVGTEIYFVKTKLKRYLNRVYFDKSSKIVQLKRRKEPRFIIPKKWAQSAKLANSVCQVCDISLSGIRFECADSQLILKNKEIVSIQFQIHKKPELKSEAIVHFFLNRTNQTSLIGMEFQNSPTGLKDRLKEIIDDIMLFQSIPKF